MNQRSAYVDSQILLMKWDDQKDGWIPDMSAMHEYHSGNLRIYNPSDAEEYLITMPGNVRWLVMFDGADVREIPEMPWIAFAIQGMLEMEIARLDEYLLTVPDEDEEVAAAVLASLSSYSYSPSPSPSPSPRIESKPQPLPAHIRTIVLERAESDGKTCPITLTPIRAPTASVTSCGHIFQAAAIQEWLSTNETCPECRQKCSIP